MTEASAPSSAPAHRHVALPELAIAIGTMALAAVLFWQTWSIPVSPVYATIGPTVFPLITAAGLAMYSARLKSHKEPKRKVPSLVGLVLK